MNEYALLCILMHVILDIFSGIPNPNWDLSQHQRDEFLKKISTLPTTDKVQNDSGLGYRGFIVEEKLKQFVVKDGLVNVVQNNKTVQVLEEKEYKIELWLLDTAPDNIDPSILKMIKEKLKQ
jgi:hypothetical protein